MAAPKQAQMNDAAAMVTTRDMILSCCDLRLDPGSLLSPFRGQAGVNFLISLSRLLIVVLASALLFAATIGTTTKIFGAGWMTPTVTNIVAVLAYTSACCCWMLVRPIFIIEVLATSRTSLNCH